MLWGKETFPIITTLLPAKNKTNKINNIPTQSALVPYSFITCVGITKLYYLACLLNVIHRITDMVYVSPFPFPKLIDML